MNRHIKSQEEYMDLQIHRSSCTVHVKEVCRLALLAGENMAVHGAESYRVEDTACRILKTTGFSVAEAHATLTGLSITLSDPSMEQGITLSKRIVNRDNDLSQISRTNEISRRFVSGDLSVEQAIAALEKLNEKRYYSTLLCILCFALVSGSYSFMFGGTPRDALACALVGLVLGAVHWLLQKLRFLGFVLNFLVSLALGLLSVCVVLFLPIGQHLQPILSGAIMPLVPGITLTVAIRDLLHGDYLSGVARSIEALICAVFLAAGVSSVVHLFEQGASALSLAAPAEWFSWGENWLLPCELLFQALCCFASSVGLAILFHAQPEHLVACGLTGAVTWFVYCLISLRLSGTAVAVFCAALTASILSYWLSRVRKAPVTVFFTGGIFCLVPGEGIYRTMYYLLGSDFSNGAAALLNTLEIAALIAIAIAVHGSLISFWEERRHHKKPHEIDTP